MMLITPKLLRFVSAIGLTILSVYLLLCPANTPLYELVLFPCPDPRVPDVTAELAKLTVGGVRYKDVSLKSSHGNTVYGWFFELPGTKRVFIYSQGKGNNRYKKLHMVAKLLRCGGSVLVYDYQGWGRSQGRATVAGACDDAVAAYDYLVQKEGRKPQDIIGYGESFGTGVTGQLCTRRKLAGVILMSAYASLKSAGRDTYPLLKMYPDWTFTGQLLDNVAVFDKPHPPLLMIHGTNDQVIKYTNGLSLYNQAVEPKMLLTLPEGRHVSFGAHGEYFSAIKEFLKKYNI